MDSFMVGFYQFFFYFIKWWGSISCYVICMRKCVELGGPYANRFNLAFHTFNKY